MAKTKHGLPITKGFFRLRGIVTGVNKENAFKKQTFDKSEKNTVKFGLKTDKESTVYVNVEGFKMDNVYLFKQSEEKGVKPLQKIVTWDERYNYEEEGYKVIGTRIGLIKNENGKNEINTFHQYDAVDELKSLLKDDMSVFVQGQIDYSSFKNREGDSIRIKKLLADAIFLSKDNINFDAEDFKPTSEFKQRIVFVGIQKDEKEDKFLVEAKIVTNNSIESTEFVIYDRQLANTFKANLKPYTAIDVSGTILSKADVEEVKETNVWGKASSFDKVNPNYIREYVIEGANPETIDTETYTQSIIDEALKKLASEGQQKSNNNDGEWGKTNKVEINEDDLPW